MTAYRKREQKRLYPIVTALRAEREAHKWPRKVIAFRMGYHETTLAKWEHGTILPSLQALHDWCQALGVTIEVGNCPRPNFDPVADFAGSLDEAYRAIRERQAAGGPGWTPKEPK